MQDIPHTLLAEFITHGYVPKIYKGWGYYPHLAELCYGLAQDGWTGEQIAKELGETEILGTILKIV